jgi:hypothetical protein
MPEVTLLDEVTHDLLDEERIALRLAVNRFCQRTRHLAARDRLQHPLHLGRAQAAQLHAAKAGLPAQVGQRRRQRMGAVHLDVAVGPDHQQPRSLQVPGQMREQVEAALVGPVQVLQHQHQRLHGAGVAQEAADRLQQAPAVLLRLAGRAWLDRQPLANLADDAGQVTGRTAQLRPQRFGWPCLDI